MNTVSRLNFLLFRIEHGIYVYVYDYDDDDDVDSELDAVDNVLEVDAIDFDNDVDSDVDGDDDEVDVVDGCAGLGV